ADAAINLGNPSSIRNEVSWVKSYEESDNKDLFDFVKNITERTIDASLAEKGKKLMDFITNQLVLDSRATHKYGGVVDEKSRGVAVYLPEYKYNPKYDSLLWSSDGRWDDFLKFLYSYTPANNPGSGNLPGTPTTSRCVDPGPNASLVQLMEYLNCLMEELNNSLPKKNRLNPNFAIAEFAF
ncbi:MAG: hypothetical protein AB1633_02870, partial [Elusimicrobiota bacterium]